MKNTNGRCRARPTPACSRRSIALGPHLCGSLHPDAHVRPSVVVEIHDVADEFACLPRALRSLHAIEPFLLDDAVDALGYGIVRRTVVFRHTDVGAQAAQTGHILVAAVLNATVGVVDEGLPVGIGPRLRNGLFQRRQRVDGLEGFRKRPPDDLAGVGIGDQVQIADSILRHDVSNVGYPKLVGGRWAETGLQEVLVLTVVMVGVRRMTAVQRLEHQVLNMHQVVEAVAPHHNLRTHVMKHQPKLVAPCAGTMAAQLNHHTYYLRPVQLTLPQFIKIVAVVSPATFPEQPADLLHA